MRFFINSIIMAGGLGTRFTPYKVILKVCGKPMIRWVYETLSEFTDKVYIVLSENRIVNTRILEMFPKESIIFTSGKGYENDIIEAISQVGLPTLVVPADTPFIKKYQLEKLILNCDKSICTLLCKNGYVGISIWRELNLQDYKDIIIDEEILNVNTLEDYIKANNICSTLLSE